VIAVEVGDDDVIDVVEADALAAALSEIAEGARERRGRVDEHARAVGLEEQAGVEEPAP
jgi:hypothetical protein